MRSSFPVFSKKNVARILNEARENAAFNAALSQESVARIRSNGSINAGLLFDLSTARNRMLITEVQQKVLSDTVVGFFGLSVGSHAAVTWMMQSRAKAIKLIDPDTIDPTNLNRLRTGWNSVGKYKVDVTAEEIRRMVPESDITTSRNTDEQSVIDLFDSFPALDCVVDEVDDLVSKFLFRRLARARRLPLISATDVGDNIVIDIERYDRNPPSPPFLGRIDYERYGVMDLLRLTPRERIRLVLEIVGLDACSNEMLKSLLGLGTTVKTWPQLGATATIAGGVVATIIKKIRLDENIFSGRYILSLDGVLGVSLSEDVVRDRSHLLSEVQRRYLS